MNAIHKLSPIEQMTSGSHSQDIGDHERTFGAFVELLGMGTLHVATCLVALAIGGVEHHWAVTVILVALASAGAAVGAASGLTWRPGAAILVIALVCLALLG